MFKDVPKTGEQEDFPAYVIGQMDKFGINKANIGINENHTEIIEAVERFPDRFFFSLPICIIGLLFILFPIGIVFLDMFPILRPF